MRPCRKTSPVGSASPGQFYLIFGKVEPPHRRGWLLAAAHPVFLPRGLSTPPRRARLSGENTTGGRRCLFSQKWARGDAKARTRGRHKEAMRAVGIKRRAEGPQQSLTGLTVSL